MRASAFALIVASAALLGSGTAEAQGRRARHAAHAPLAESVDTGGRAGDLSRQGPYAGRPLTSRDGGTIHWNTGNEWGNLGGPGGGGSGGLGG